MQDKYNSELWDRRLDISSVGAGSYTEYDWKIGEVEPYGEGEYLRVNDHSYYAIQFPDEVNTDTRICITCKGAGGYHLDDIESVHRITDLRDENIIVISPRYQDDTNYRVSQKISQELQDENSDLYAALLENGINIQEAPNDNCITYGGHSNSCKTVVGSTIQYLTHERESEDGQQTRAAILLNDPEHTQLLNAEGRDNLDKLDDSVVMVNTQQQYMVTDDSGNFVGATDALSSYKGDLEDMARAGATVIVAGYAMEMGGQGGNFHTESVEMTSQYGLYDLANATLVDGKGSFVSARNGKTITFDIDYYYFDAEKDEWVTLKDAKEAQAILDYSTGKVELYNSGFLVKEDGTYILNGTQISEDELKNLILDYKESGDQSISLEDYIKENVGKHSGGTDKAEFNHNDTLKAVEALSNTLNSIQKHMDSLVDFDELHRNSSSLNSFFNGASSFPSGVNASSFSSAEECVRKFGQNIENAYNISVNVHTTLLHAEDLAPTYYKSNEFSSSQSASSKVGFATDMQQGNMSGGNNAKTEDNKTYKL